MGIILDAIAKQQTAKLSPDLLSGELFVFSLNKQNYEALKFLAPRYLDADLIFSNMQLIDNNRRDQEAQLVYPLKYAVDLAAILLAYAPNNDCGLMMCADKKLVQDFKNIYFNTMYENTDNLVLQKLQNEIEEDFSLLCED